MFTIHAYPSAAEVSIIKYYLSATVFVAPAVAFSIACLNSASSMPHLIILALCSVLIRIDLEFLCIFYYSLLCHWLVSLCHVLERWPTAYRSEPSTY